MNAVKIPWLVGADGEPGTYGTGGPSQQLKRAPILSQIYQDSLRKIVM